MSIAFQALAVIRINEAKFQFGDARKLIARFLNLGRVESGDLNQDAIVPHRSDDRLAAAEVVDTFANDLDRLIEHRLGDFLVPLDQADEE